MKRESPGDEFEGNVKKVKDEKPNIGKLSAYEKMIQKNRDEKIAFLESLRMDEVKEGLNEAIKNLKPKRAPKKSSIKSSTPQVPTRKSVRLEKIDSDLFEKAVEEARVLAEAEKEIEKKLQPILPFEEAITGDNVYSNFVHDFGDLDFEKPKPFTDYASCFKNMKIDESKIAKVVNGNITAMALHPMQEKIIVCAGSTHGAVGFWQVNSNSVPYEFKPHNFGVSCLKFHPDSPSQVFSCSYDGTMLCGDIEKKVFNQVFKISDKISCNYFDFLSPTSAVVCQSNGNISIVDIRSASKSRKKSYKWHGCSVKTGSVHPVKKNYFVSADMKGFLFLWDLRMSKKRPVTKVQHHRKQLTSALFSPVTGNSILTASTDDCLCLLNSSKLGRTLPLETKVGHNTYQSFKAAWLPNTDDAFVIGSVKYPRRIQIFNNKLESIYNFQDEEYLNCMTSTNVFHPSLPVLAGGNSSGKVYIFS